MPENKNGMPFEAYPSPMKDKDGKTLLYVRPQQGQKIDFESFENYCTGQSDVKSGDMTRIFNAFIKGTALWLAKGCSIDTPIGIFKPKIGLKRQMTNPDDITSGDVEFLGIDFQPHKKFEGSVARIVEMNGFRYIPKAVTSRVLKDEGRLRGALKASLEANKGYTTVASFTQYSGLTKYAAARVLDKWCKADVPILQKTRIGGAYIYTEI